MSTYAIGDLHGCLEPLQSLLHKLNYNPAKDTLWFTGDIINRGPESLATLDFIYQLPESTVVVLGNHDISMMAVHAGIRKLKDTETFHDVLDSPSVNKYITWLRHKPLLHHDPILGYTLSHAGILPLWDIKTAQNLSNEVAALFKSNQYHACMQQLFGNEPTKWGPGLSGFERIRFIVNAFTRMRYCTLEGHLTFEVKCHPSQNQTSHVPWFDSPIRKTKGDKLIFGHWASLEGKCATPNIYALDTGCVWGKTLTALCLETGERISSPNGYLLDSE